MSEPVIIHDLPLVINSAGGCLGHWRWINSQQTSDNLAAYDWPPFWGVAWWSPDPGLSVLPWP